MQSTAAISFRCQRLLALLESAPNLDLPRTFLEQRNRGPLPPAIVDLFRRVEEDSSALQIQSKALTIRVRSPAVAQAVLNDPIAGKIVRQLDERTFLIPANKETALRNALRALGYGLRGRRFLRFVAFFTMLTCLWNGSTFYTASLPITKRNPNVRCSFVANSSTLSLAFAVASQCALRKRLSCRWFAPEAKWAGLVFTSVLCVAIV